MERAVAGKWGGRDREREREGVLLAVSVLQIEVRVEVDEDFLTSLGGRYHPHAELGGWVGAGVTWGGQVVRIVDHYVSPAFICTTNEGRR